NVLIKDNGDACLTNFGLLQALEAACDVIVAIALFNLRSVRWMAPEIYDPELIGKERGTISAEADCHSFGMLILELVTGQEPFSYIPQDDVVIVELVRGGRPIRPTTSYNNRRPQYQTMDDPLWEICESCWTFPPNKRMNAEE
ncbi:kinase-like domain-containing protein, partial [Cantharellus anzutake]|uniref:kinase-like domain-containing protein n=1 Tax=Cantharellus anzutake TaxID=1750568 RepID=UPI0019089299